MKIGNTSFNLESLSKMTKDEFISRYAGKIGADINEAAKTLSKHFKKIEDVKTYAQETYKKRSKKK